MLCPVEGLAFLPGSWPLFIVIELLQGGWALGKGVCACAHEHACTQREWRTERRCRGPESSVLGSTPAHGYWHFLHILVSELWPELCSLGTWWSLNSRSVFWSPSFLPVSGCLGPRLSVRNTLRGTSWQWHCQRCSKHGFGEGQLGYVWEPWRCTDLGL